MSRSMPARSGEDLRRTFALACLAAWSVAGTATAQEIQKPQPEYKVLAADEGTWDATIRTYERGPDAEPSVSRGTEVNEVMPGGLWVLSKFDGGFGGMKFQAKRK